LVIDYHHLALYGAVVAIAGLGAYGYHVKALDVAEAKAKAAAEEQIIGTIQKRMDDREKEFKDQITTLLAMKSAPATTPAQIVERIPQYFPQLQPTLQQPVNPQTGKPDLAAPAQLVFDAPQAKILNDTLVDCKVCSLERDKLKVDLADQKNITLERTNEVQQWKKAAAGGSIWKRAGRVLKWGAIGFGIGYVVAKR
jgi:hypothetical protein